MGKKINKNESQCYEHNPTTRHNYVHMCILASFRVEIRENNKSPTIDKQEQK